MKPRLTLTATFCIFVLGMSGCRILFQYNDVTENPKYWGGFRPGENYRLQPDVFVVGTEEPSKKWAHTLVAPGNPMYDVPATADDYRDNPTAYQPQGPGDFAVRGVLTTGTRLQVTRLMSWDPLTSDKRQVATFATALDGPFQGQEFSLHRISHAPSEDKLRSYSPNDAYLVPVAPIDEKSKPSILKAVDVHYAVYLARSELHTTITPSGLLRSTRMTNKSYGPNDMDPKHEGIEIREGRLTATQMTELAALFTGWDLLSDVPYGGVADGGEICVKYGEKSVSGGSAAPKQVWDVHNRVAELAASMPVVEK